MADNVRLNPGAGGDLAASDEIGGVQHQLVKIEIGENGTATPVSGSNPLPIQQRGCVASPTQSFDVGDDMVTIASTNASRVNILIHNHSDDELFVGLGNSVSESTFFTALRAYEDYEFGPVRYVGPIVVIRASGASEGSVMVTEIVGA